MNPTETIVDAVSMIVWTMLVAGFFIFILSPDTEGGTVTGKLSYEIQERDKALNYLQTNVSCQYAKENNLQLTPYELINLFMKGNPKDIAGVHYDTSVSYYRGFFENPEYTKYYLAFHKCTTYPSYFANYKILKDGEIVAKTVNWMDLYEPDIKLNITTESGIVTLEMDVK